MSSFLCFICHSTVNEDMSDNMREQYKEVVGINLCCYTHLCHICCHILSKLWMFKSICLKRSLEYPVLISEKGTMNLQKSVTHIHSICNEETCEEHLNYNADSNIYIYNYKYFFNDCSNTDSDLINDYMNLYNDIKVDCHDDEELNMKNCDNVYDEECNDEMVFDDEIVNDDNFEVNDVIALPNYNVDVNNEKSDEDVIPECHDDEELNTKKCDVMKGLKRYEKVVLSLDEQKADLEHNRKSKKYLESEFKCSSCGLGFLFKDSYQAHMMRHEESNGEYRCVICKLRFANPAVLRVHKSLHSERYKCVKCETLIRKRQRDDHAALCHGVESDNVTCHMCGRVFKHSKSLQQHLRRFHQSKSVLRSYSCNVCGKRFNKQAAVRTHMITHINKKFHCETCSASFSSPYTLKQHLKKHDIAYPTESHWCILCKRLFASRKYLLAHNRNVHQEDSIPCTKCSRVCKNRQALVKHLAWHNRPTDKPTKRKPAKANTSICYRCGAAVKGNKLNRHLKEVCQKNKLEEELSSYYAQDDIV